MKELTLKDMQQVLFDILKDIHAFCIKNDIQYSLAYGTLLGAVRHKGFIPWDDDIDLYMTRPNYERFIKAYKSENGYVMVPPSDSYIAFARVCDTKRTFMKSTLPWFPSSRSKELGLWVDIFPIDGLDDIGTMKKKMPEITAIRRLQLTARRAMPNPSFDLSLKHSIRQILRKIKYCRLDVKKVNKQLIDRCSETPYETAPYCSQFACNTVGESEWYEKRYFEDLIELEFEGEKFLAPKDWDSVLNIIFGSDYMTPPPEDKREQHSLDHNRFFWKDA